MSVQSEINRINSAVSASYTAVSNKGGTLPASRVIANLATAINSIPSGTTDYNALDNKPTIGGVEVSGDKYINDYGGVLDTGYPWYSDGGLPAFTGESSIACSYINIGEILNTQTLKHISISASLDSGGGSTIIEVSPNVTPWAISAVPYTVNTGDSYGRSWTVVPTINSSGKVTHVTAWAKNPITRIDITIIGTTI